MTPNDADDMTVSLFRAYLDAPPAAAFPDRPQAMGPVVIRIPGKRVLSPAEEQERQARDALEQAVRRRDELTVLATFERLFPGQAIPARYTTKEAA